MADIPEAAVTAAAGAHPHYAFCDAPAECSVCRRVRDNVTDHLAAAAPLIAARALRDAADEFVGMRLDRYDRPVRQWLRERADRLEADRGT